MVERFFRDLTQRRLRRGVFRDVEELIAAIGDYIDKHNDNPKPFLPESPRRRALGGRERGETEQPRGGRKQARRKGSSSPGEHPE
jgi:hypothetical protein